MFSLTFVFPSLSRITQTQVHLHELAGEVEREPKRQPVNFNPERLMRGKVESLKKHGILLRTEKFALALRPQVGRK